MHQLQHTSIGVFDSGIGGLSVANAISGLLPRESLLYVADNARAPYGPQSPAEILAYSRQITRFLLDQEAKLIVVACNTATSVAIDTLRDEFPEVPFVGLEPAVKPAQNGQAIGVLATSATLQSARYLKLREKYLAGVPVYEDACRGLVSIIEAAGPGSQQVQAKLRLILEPMLAAGIDTLVLGCTHYPIVKTDIAAICGPTVQLIDPSAAAAKQVERMLTEHSLLSTTAHGTSVRGSAEQSRSTHDFYCTGSSLPLQRTLFTLPSLNKFRRLVIPAQTY